MVCIFQGQSGKQFEKWYIIPGREIPKSFEKVNICDTSVFNCSERNEVKIQLPLPGSGSGFDEWWGIVLCVVFLPTECHQVLLQRRQITVGGLVLSYLPLYRIPLGITSEYGKVESHHLWLCSFSKLYLPRNRLAKTPGCSIDKNGFHQVELKINAWGLEVEKIGFRVV